MAKQHLHACSKFQWCGKDDITSDDIYAVVEAGALAGVLRKQEHELINV